jgi:hypothetical protein
MDINFSQLTHLSLGVNRGAVIKGPLRQRQAAANKQTRVHNHGRGAAAKGEGDGRVVAALFVPRVL